MNIPDIEFEPFEKMARLSRETIITEKIDGTNATVYVDTNGGVFAGSRNKWITPNDDNYGFAAWVAANKQELRELGPGIHRGEWWGQGIQRGYGLKEKRLSLFNVQRWALHGTEPKTYPTMDPRVTRTQDVLPPCCGLVPVLDRCLFDSHSIDLWLHYLQTTGSMAAPGFLKPEGLVVFHIAGNVGFKKTLGNDGHKGVK